jgi:hypothetical protein
MSAQLIESLMERIHVLTQENNKLKHENQKQKETIERLGGQVAQDRSTGMAEPDHGTAGEVASVCGANRVVGLLCRQDGAEPLAGNGHVAPPSTFRKEMWPSNEEMIDALISIGYENKTAHRRMGVKFAA